MVRFALLAALMLACSAAAAQQVSPYFGKCSAAVSASHSMNIGTNPRARFAAIKRCAARRGVLDDGTRLR